eukprot:s466_g27.t1
MKPSRQQQPKKSPARPRARSRKKSTPRMPEAEPSWMPDQDEDADGDNHGGTSSSVAEEHLTELMKAVQKMEQPLTTDVQRALLNAQKAAGVDPTRQLESAVSRMRNARDQLRQARAARQKMHQSWAKFITEAVQRWNKHSEDFEQRDAEHLEAIQAAVNRYQTAKQIMESSKDAVTANDGVIEDGADVNDDELMADDTTNIQSDLLSMVQNFEKIRARQAETIEGSAAKKPRTEGDANNASKPLPGSADAPGPPNAYETSVLHHLPVSTDRAIYDMDRAWLMDLQVQWREHATVDHPGEGRMLQVRTWYLHHQDVPRCDRPRLVKLDYMDHLWLSDIREIWADMIRPGEVLHLTSVTPSPPQADFQPFEVNVIVSQGLTPDRIGIILTARFIQTHRTQLIQEAVSAPRWMCGTRAIDLLRIPHLVQDRRWIARSGVIMLSADELEPISDGISIVIDIQTPDPETDENSLASWTRSFDQVQISPAVPHSDPSPSDDSDPDDDLPDEAGSDSAHDTPQDGDWRFVHLYRTQRRVYHGHLPWNDAVALHRQVSAWTRVDERDIVHLYPVLHGPADLKAANIRPLLFHSVTDLPLGSVLRLVLVDVEFHEHVPSIDVSTSRRNLALPHQVARRALLRLLGIDVYCERVRQRCMIWINHELLPNQCSRQLVLEHGDYIRVAIPPLPHVPAHISTRVCVSSARQNIPRHAYRRPTDHRHEAGMTDVDDLERQRYGRFVHDHDDDDPDDQMTLFQHAGVYLFSFPKAASTLLTSEVAAAFDVNVCTEVPQDKIEDEPAERLHEARQQAAHQRPQRHLEAHNPVVQALHDQFVRFHEARGEGHHDAFFVGTWYSHHTRRPHSGMGRMVELSDDFTTWMATIINAWDDWVDPFHTLTYHLANPHPEGGDPDAVVHLVLVQGHRHDHFSSLVSITDIARDPWHPQLMCLTVPRWHVHRALQDLADLDHLCDQQPSQRICRSWFGAVEITHEQDVFLFHGAALTFLLQRTESWPLPTDDADDDSVVMLQKKTTLTRSVLELAPLLPDPIWVRIDCRRLDFLRTQLCQWSPLTPSFQRQGIQWHAATLAALGDLPDWMQERPIGLTFYTDGTASRSSSRAAAAVVLIVHTLDGLRWGGFVTAPCIGDPSAPRAEATALLLTSRWMHQLMPAIDSTVWMEIAFDCVSIAGVAQGTLNGRANADLTSVIRALIHWLQTRCPAQIHWTHLHSHRGHPWNEAADTICKHAAATDAPGSDLVQFHAQCGFDGHDLSTIQWLWLFEKSLAHDPAAPVVIDGFWTFNIATPLSHQPDSRCHPFRWRAASQPDGPRLLRHLQLRLSTANVLTLFPGQDYASGYFGARAESLAQQFQHCGLHFVGLQETRSKSTGHSSIAGFHVLSAPATQRGIGGVQLWVRRHIHVGEVHLHVEPQHLQVLHASARRLIVQFACEGLRAIFIVVHAPTSDDEEVLHAFWQATTNAIPSRFASWCTFVLADANSRLGSVESVAVGSHHMDDENQKGGAFHEWLLEHRLALPQTFSSCHSGTGWTWTHPAGQRARLDYIACPQELVPHHVSTWIEPGVDLALHRPDHECVCAQVTLSFYAQKASPSVSTSVPFAPADVRWATDVHTHAAALQARLRGLQKTQIRKRKPHLTDETMKLILAKKFHRKRLHAIHHSRRQAILRQLFQAWRDDQPCLDRFQPWLQACDRHAAWHEYVAADLAPRVIRAVRQDDRDFYEALAITAGRDSSRGSRQLWSAIRSALPKWRQKQRSNLRCVGPTIADKFAHYNDLEAGEGIDYDHLLVQCVHAQQRAAQDAPLCLALCDLPTRSQLESMLARLKPNKAPGLDAVTPSTLREQGASISEDLVNLFMKIWLTGAEPLQFKGGLLHTIGKKQKSNLLKDMRGIALLDGLGKLSHAVLRSQMLPALQEARAPLQLGGFPHQSTLFATQYLRAFTCLADSKHLSSAVLFLDVKSAFHSLIRELVFDQMKPMPPRLRDVLIAQGCDPDGVQGRADLFCGNDGVPLATSRLLSDAHQHTWYTVAASDEVQWTHRGSRPGSPLADAAYNSMMIEFIHELQMIVHRHPVLQAAGVQLGVQPHIVAWVDDVAIPLVSGHANQLTSVVAWVLEEVIRLGHTFGLTINLKPTKTEAVVAFRGADAVVCRQECFQERQGRICTSDAQHCLQCVSGYEHLGTIYTPDAAVAREVSHRINKATQAYHQIRKPILHNSHLERGTRLRLLEGLLFPILLHGAGNWPLLSQQQLTRLQGVTMKWIRSVIGNGPWTPDMDPDHVLLMKWNLPTLALRLAKMRLLYAFHLVTDGPGLVVELVTATHQHSKSWFPALRHALTWLQRMDPAVFPWDPVRVDPEMIIAWLHERRQDGPRLVRRLYHRALHQGRVVGQVVTMHERLHRCLRVGGAFFNKEAEPRPHVSADYECRLCARQFASWQRLQVHQWLAHEVISEERSFMTSTVCEACHTCYRTAQRLQQHLRYSRRHRAGCYERLTWRCAPHAAGVPIDDVDVAHKFHRCPAVPVPFVATHDECMIDSRCEADRLLQRHWELAGLPLQHDLQIASDMIPALDAVVRQASSSEPAVIEEILFKLTGIVDDIDAVPMQAFQGEWTFCLWILDEVRCSRFCNLSSDLFQQLDGALQQLVRASPVGRLLSWQRRMDAAHQPALCDPHPDAEGGLPGVLEPILDPCQIQGQVLSKMFDEQVVCPPSKGIPVCLIDGTPTLLILHLYSGRRRVGDCHWWLQHIGAHLFPYYPIKLISVDTAIDPVDGNLAADDNIFLILTMARKGAFAAVLTGPPCETWSAARGLELDTLFGPRILRSAAQPWCLPDRSARELRQCSMGATLLFNSLQIEVSVACAGGGTLMEHPYEAAEPHKASVWRLSCHERWCMALRQAHRHRVEQWLYGAIGIKPTCLRALNLGPPEVVGQALMSGAEMWRTRPSRGLRGRNQDGSFRTAGAKEYPSALCRSLIVAVLRGLSHRLQQEGPKSAASLTAQESAWQASLGRKSEDLALSSFLPDYQGTMGFELKTAERKVNEKEDAEKAALEKAIVREIDANEKFSAEEKAFERKYGDKAAASKVVQTMATAERQSSEKVKLAKTKMELAAVEMEALRKLVQEKEKAWKSAYEDSLAPSEKRGLRMIESHSKRQDIPKISKDPKGFRWNELHEAAAEMAKAMSYGSEKEKLQKKKAAKVDEEKEINAQIAKLKLQLVSWHVLVVGEEVQQEKEALDLMVNLKDAAEKTAFKQARNMDKKATKILADSWRELLAFNLSINFGMNLGHLLESLGQRLCRMFPQHSHHSQ